MSIIIETRYELKILSGNIRNIRFDVYFDESIEGIDKIQFLENVYFGEMFNQSIEPIGKCAHIRHITFGANFNQSIEPLRKLKYLESITFGNNFNQSITPLEKLKHLNELHFVGGLIKKPFKYPLGRPIIKIGRETPLKYNFFFTNLYSKYSEYIEQDTGNIKVNGNTFEYKDGKDIYREIIWGDDEITLSRGYMDFDIIKLKNITIEKVDEWFKNDEWNQTD